MTDQNRVLLQTEQNRITLNNGVRLYPFSSFDELIEYAQNRKKLLVAINAEKILHATPQTMGIINRNIGYCDGTGAVMAAKQHGTKNAIKLPGCELWLKIIEKLYPQGKTFYLVGSRPEVIVKTVMRLKTQFPGIDIIGYRDGYLKDEKERNDLIEEITTKKPDVVFVAMGSPKQEILMEEMWQWHNAIYQGLGGSFDVYTGNVKRAPKWWVDHNLEFAYRLVKQPSRIKRQIFLLKYFVLLTFGRF